VVIGFGYALAKPGTAVAVGRLLRAFSGRWIAGPILGMLAWSAGAAVIAGRFGVWAPDLMKDTTEWFVLSAMLLYINITKAYETPRYFRRAVFDNLKLTAFVIFYVNVFVFPYPIELALILLTTLLAGCSVIGEFRPEARAAKRLCDGLLGASAAFLLVFSTQQIITHWATIDFAHQVRLLILPIWLTAALVPYLYAWSLFGSYLMAFHRIRFFAPQRALRRRTRFAIIRVLTVRAHAVAEIRSPWLQRFASAGTFQQALAISREYLYNWSTNPKVRAAGPEGGHSTTIALAIPIPGIREILRREREAANEGTAPQEREA
jgi:hypothetical protein